MDPIARIAALNGALAGVRVYIEAIERWRKVGQMPSADLVADALAHIDTALQRDDDAVAARMRATVDILAAQHRHEPPVFATAAE